jgi:hypothetical protein
MNEAETRAGLIAPAAIRRLGCGRGLQGGSGLGCRAWWDAAEIEQLPGLIQANGKRSTSHLLTGGLSAYTISNMRDWRSVNEPTLPVSAIHPYRREVTG